jgi:energy-coupling factor transport system ATP-binding protein
MAAVAGMVFQEPEAQAVAETVLEEVAFGLEQQAVPRPEMHRRVDRALGQLNIEPLRHRRLATLSGGERQRVALAAVLALQPRLLLLDEPTSQLDTAGAEALLTALDGLHRVGLTVLLAEHRLDRVLPRATSVVSVAQGHVEALRAREALQRLEAVPTLAGLFRREGLAPPMTLAEARAAGAPFRAVPRRYRAPGELLIEARGVSVVYGEHVALRDASFELREGECVALIGPNGSGKSTLFRALAGLATPASGVVQFPALPGPPRGVAEVTRFAGLVPQDPALALYRDTVAEELQESLEHRFGKRVGGEKVLAALERWGLGELAHRNPRDVSVGQQQRVAFGAMLAHEPRVWLLDEPTRGADVAAREALAERLSVHAAAGGAAIVATHDIEGSATWATRVITLSDGAVTSDLPAHAAFAAGGPHPTQVARLVPGAICAAEVELAP